MPAESSSASPTVLVVDDEAVNRQLLESILAPEGYRVLQAGDGVEALEVVARETVDVVILDVLMPRMDGFETCLRLRARNATLPILIATALGDRASRIRGIEAGADDVLTKPIDDLEMLTRVRNLTRMLRLHQAHAAARGRIAREWAAAEADARLRRVYESLACGVIVYDASGGIVEANQEACMLVGATLEELRGASVLSVCQCFTEDGAPLSFGAGAAGRALATGLARRQETMRVIRRDGTVRWLQVDAVPMLDSQRRHTSVVSSLLDITVRKTADELLARSEERYRVLFDRSPLAMVLFDQSTFEFLAVNAAAERLYQYSREELSSMKLSDLKAASDMPELLEAMAATEKGEWSAVRTHRRKDGSLIDVGITSHPVTVDGRQAMCAMMSDVTETKRLEEQLRQSQKMEAIGSLAGGIAHDFNNILAVILSDAEFATSALEGHPARADVLEITAAAQRAAALTNQLLMFSRQQPWQPKVIRLNAIVTDLESMLSRTIGEHVAMSAVLDPRLGSIEADPGQIEQVVMNLVVNARDAMPAGGKLTIETRNVDVDAANAAELGLSAGRYVALVVSDAGCGMDAATKARIFEPFFTTKGVGKGTGLGLATVFGIVNQSGGVIAVHSQPGRGTSVQIHFPRVAATADSIEPSGSAEPTGGSETVLVVEDDAHVRGVVLRALRAKGYDVIEAPNARVALETLQRAPHRVQLVVTDLVMPDVDGRTMAAEALRNDPAMKVLFMSGYTEHATVKGGRPETPDHFIQKPFTACEIARAVRRAIDGGAGRVAI